MRRGPALALAVIVSWALSAGGCDLFFRTSTTDAGPSVPDANLVVDVRWTLTPPRDPRVELGAWLVLEVDEVRASELPIMLHVAGHEAPYPILFQRRLGAPPASADAGVPEGEDAGPLADAGIDDAPGRWSIATVLPVREGLHLVALGDDEQPLTAFTPIEVVAPSRRYEPAEVAGALEGGLAAMVEDTRIMLEGTDDETRALMAELVGADERAMLESALDDLDSVSATVGEDYMAMSPEDERLLQAMYVNTGLYDTMIASRDGMMTQRADYRAIPFVDRLAAYANRPMQALLFTLDTFSFVLGALGTICDVVEIVSAISGVGLPAAATAVGVKLTVAFLKILLETFLPVDLLSIEVHGQSRLFADEGARFLHWGRFGPQNATGSVVRSLEDLALLAVAEAVPAGAALPARMLATRVIQSSRAALRYIAERVPGAAVEAFLNASFPGELRLTGLYTPLDLRVYRLRLSELLALIPIGGWAVHGIFAAFWDPDVVDPLVLRSVSPPAWGAAARLSIDYSIADFAVRGIAFPGAMPVERAFVSVESSGWHFGQIGSFGNVIQVPWPESVSFLHEPIAVQSRPDASIGEELTDEHIVFDRIPGAGVAGTDRRTIFRDTPTTRVYDVIFVDEELGLDPDRPNTTITVLVNGTPAISEMRIVNGARVPLSLRPGLNEVVIVAGEPEAGICTNEGVLPARTWCIAASFPDAMNVDVSRDIDLDPGQTFTYRVWTPPAIR